MRLSQNEIEMRLQQFNEMKRIKSKPLFINYFITIQPLILRGKLKGMGVDHILTSGIRDYLTELAHFSGLRALSAG